MVEINEVLWEGVNIMLFLQIGKKKCNLRDVGKPPSPSFLSTYYFLPQVLYFWNSTIMDLFFMVILSAFFWNANIHAKSSMLWLSFQYEGLSSFHPSEQRPSQEHRDPEQEGGSISGRGKRGTLFPKASACSWLWIWASSQLQTFELLTN